MPVKCVWAVVIWCAALASPSAVANGAEVAPKKLVVIPIEKIVDLDEAAKTARKFIPTDAAVVPLPIGHALLAYATDEDARVLRKVLTPFIEKP